MSGESDRWAPGGDLWIRAVRAEQEEVAILIAAQYPEPAGFLGDDPDPNRERNPF